MKRYGKILNEMSIAEALFLSLKSSSLVIAPRYTPLNWFECDVYSITRSGYFVEHEIKCSVADIRADSRKENKHERLSAGDAHGPSRFYFVVPENMIDPSTVPEWAGLKWAIPEPRRLRPRLRVVKESGRLHKVKVENPLTACQDVHRALYYRYWYQRLRVGPVVPETSS